jgi:hypothetical protein
MPGACPIPPALSTRNTEDISTQSRQEAKTQSWQELFAPLQQIADERRQEKPDAKLARDLCAFATLRLCVKFRHVIGVKSSRNAQPAKPNEV